MMMCRFSPFDFMLELVVDGEKLLIGRLLGFRPSQLGPGFTKHGGRPVNGTHRVVTLLVFFLLYENQAEQRRSCSLSTWDSDVILTKDTHPQQCVAFCQNRTLDQSASVIPLIILRRRHPAVEIEDLTSYK